MPIRLVREGINSSPRVNSLSMGAELLYRRLMSVVDDYGRFHGSITTIRGACWPTCPDRFKEREVVKWLEECGSGDRPLIRMYDADGARYLEIADFGQQIRTKSKFPTPPWGDPIIPPSIPRKVGSKQKTERKQTDSSLLADGKQSVQPSRTTYYVVEDELRTTNAQQPEDEPLKFPNYTDWPQTAAAVREPFPGTDDLFILKLVTKSCMEAAGVGKELDDGMLARAVKECRKTSPRQTSAGLFLSTVPQCAKTWLQNGESPPGKPLKLYVPPTLESKTS